jgi:transcription-repair coupling factor (superfamily II helicase)
VDLKELLSLYRKDKRTQQLAKLLQGDKLYKISIDGLVGSVDSVVAVVAQQHTEGSFMFILNDKEEAAYFLNNIENLVGERQIFFFPGSYNKPYHIGDIDNANVLLRAEMLNRINKSDKDIIIVTYPEAINEKVVTKRNLTQNTIDVRVGESISIDFITDFLEEYDFERTDFVVEAGQFAVRGGIVDVFSFANELPYRIEFFGDEIDSIRSFEPGNQLSVTQLNHVTLIPNVQTKLLKESRESFFDFIHKDTKIWIKDTQHVLSFIEEGYAKAIDISDVEITQLKPEEILENKQEIKAHLEKFCIVEFGTKNYYTPQHTITYNIAPQPSFNKNFQLLTENLANNTREGYDNIIFADAAKQIERIYAIFEDIGKSISFSPLLVSLHEGFIDRDLKLACYTDHQIFDRYHRFRLRKQYTKNESITLKEIYNLKPGDYIAHIDHGIGKFAGLEKVMVNEKMQEAIRLVYKDNDMLYISIHSLHRITRYSGKEGTVPTLNKLGTTTWATLKQKTKKKVKDIAKDLIALYAKRKAQKGFAFSPDTYLQNELEASFIYEDTPDQEKATRDVKKDMQSPHPMDRLICGDVGFGKTEIAIRAAFKAVADSKQVAILVPTTVLALQHYKTFRDRFKDLPCNVDYINRFKSPAQQRDTIERLEAGKIDILIGTHRILSKEIKFKDLGLMIIDEEQKFGVASKEKLKAMRTNVDTLTLTATPIPRTLQFSLMGARDLSIINTPPPNRYPVTTELHVFDEKVIKEAVAYEVSRGGQVFFIHNRVADIHNLAAMIERLCPDVKTCVGHGQMDGDKLEEVMLGFVEGEFDVLVSTTIIESGLDIPNANTIIINQANNFGLSDIHQMRGRVGRSNKKAFCYLLAPPISVLTPEAKQRLTAIQQFSELGSGFNISMRDLDIRGAGNLLGGEQSGFISEIGFDMYHKILDEAIQELKEEEFKDLFSDKDSKTTSAAGESRNSLPASTFVRDCQIDTDMEILIPDYYVDNITERLSLYTDLDDIEKEEKLVDFEAQLKDRFGPVPEQVIELLNTIRLRWLAKSLGFEKLILKNKRFVGYFVANPSSPFFESEVFTNVLKFVQQNQRGCKMKETNGKLTLSFENIKTIEEARRQLEGI